MAILSNIAGQCFGSATQKLKTTSFTVLCRFASKKTGGSTRNAGNSKAKHRGWKRQDGSYVHAGEILATQNTTRFHPGLNVGIGKNGTLFAMYSGKVVVTCEVINPIWESSWIKKNYEGREGQIIYKKHFNVIPEPEHNRFKLINKI